VHASLLCEPEVLLVSIDRALRNGCKFDVTELAQHLLRYLRDFPSASLHPIRGT
jgi:hypothetical protein